MRRSNGDGIPTVFTSRCLACGAPIGWVKTLRGFSMPVDEDLGPHFATCPAADLFRRKRNRRAAPPLPQQLSFLPPAPVQGELTEL